MISFDKDYEKEITREEKLEYINTRLNDYQLHAIMNLAVAFEFYEPTKQEVQMFFETMRSLILSYYSVQGISWTSCPIPFIKSVMDEEK